MAKLTDKFIKSLISNDKKQRHGDGEGLSLIVDTKGGKYWYFRYKKEGKAKEFSLGPYPTVSLKEARDKARAYRDGLQQGEDPAVAKLKEQYGISDASSTIPTFGEVAEQHFQAHFIHKAETTRQRARTLLDNYFNDFNNLPIDQITPVMCLALLRQIEAAGKTSTAHKARTHLGLIFRYAMVPLDVCKTNPIEATRGALKPHVSKHFAAVTTPKELGKLLLTFEQYTGSFIVKNALFLTPYILCRPGMLRSMRWDELDLDEGVWTVSPEKLKYELHDGWKTWLSRQAVDLIKELYPYTRGRSPYVFPSLRGNQQCISENTVRSAMRVIGIDSDTATPHGFRATGRTLLAEELEYPAEWIEMELAHVVKDSNGTAYNRARFKTQRKAMMQHWADYLDGLREQARKDTTKFVPQPLL